MTIKDWSNLNNPNGYQELTRESMLNEIEDKGFYTENGQYGRTILWRNSRKVGKFASLEDAYNYMNEQLEREKEE